MTELVDATDIGADLAGSCILPIREGAVAGLRKVSMAELAAFFGGGGGGGGMTLIEEITTIAAQTSVDFAAIPAGFTHLRLVAKFGSVSADGSNSEGLFLQFNADTGTNYRYTLLGTYNNGTGFGAGSNAGVGARVALAASTGVPEPLGSATIDIPDYAGADPKSLNAQATCVQGTAGILQLTAAGSWSGTAAINEITLGLLDGSNAFATGSKFWLYGLG